MDRRELTAAALLVVAQAAWAARIAFYGQNALAASFLDDAYYYLQIARHVAAGHGFTFDGIHPTNGFQPLWLFVLVPVFRLVPGDLAPLRVVLLLQSVLVLLVSLALLRVLRPRIGVSGALAAALILLVLPEAHGALFTGMEGALVLLLLMAVWISWLRIEERPDASLARWLGLGVGCALLFLARIEALLAVPILVGLARRPLRSRPRALAALVIPPLACVVAYLIWNHASFGSFLPVSALVKRSRHFQTFDISWLALSTPLDELLRRFLPRYAVPAQLVCVALVLAAAVHWRRQIAPHLRAAGAPFVLLVAGLMLLADKLGTIYLAVWHMAPLMLAMAVVGGLMVSRARRGLRWAALIALLLLHAKHVAFVWTIGDSPAMAGRLKAVAWLEEHSAPESRIASWNAGRYAYFMHRPVVNLDGLVNSVDYFREVILPQTMGRYLDREGIDWVVDTPEIFGPRPQMLFSFEIGTDVVVHDFQEVARFGDEQTGSVVWRRRGR